MRTIIIKGKASNKVICKIKVLKKNEHLSLLNFLSANEVPIASSCQGAGVCRKCIVNDNLLSCQITLKELCEKYPNLEVDVAYL